ncbi:MAG: isoprenyl transferase [Symbiobacteriia bacterium]
MRAARSAKPSGELDESRLPRHVAIIMDGNGRWATERHLPRVAGHRAGVEAVRDIIKTSSELGIAVLTLYSFSTENWKRPQDEVEALMRLLAEYLHSEIDELHRNNVKIMPIGRIDEMPLIDRVELTRAVSLTSRNTGLQLNLALNYGGRAELTDAVRAIAKKVKGHELEPDAITPELISQHLYTAGLPDPDLLIRTGGDSRLSNFLLWQVAYTEIWVTPTYWPAFKSQHLRQALADYAARERRFGGINAR